VLDARPRRHHRNGRGGARPKRVQPAIQLRDGDELRDRGVVGDFELHGHRLAPELAYGLSLPARSALRTAPIHRIDLGSGILTTSDTIEVPCCARSIA
jgi:hypothetical protein